VKNTGAPGEKPRLSAERWQTLFTWVNINIFVGISLDSIIVEGYCRPKLSNGNLCTKLYVPVWVVQYQCEIAVLSGYITIPVKNKQILVVSSSSSRVSSRTNWLLTKGLRSKRRVSACFFSGSNITTQHRKFMYMHLFLILHEIMHCRQRLT
jgi:hypothetical protein